MNMTGSRTRSPLGNAILYDYSDVALLLLDMGATATRDDLSQAIRHGDHRVVSRLLDQLPTSEVNIVECELCHSIRDRYEGYALNILGLNIPIRREKALRLALEYGQLNVAVKLVESGARLTVPQLIWAFRILGGSTLRTWVKSLALTLTGERGHDGRTLLESAILSGNVDVVNFALSLEPLAYDSGTLCAAVLAAARSIAGMEEILHKILQMRELEDRQVFCFDPILENTAICIAAYYRRLDIVLHLQKYSNHETNAAVLPQDAYPWPRNAKTPCPIDYSETLGHYFSMKLDGIRDLPWYNWHCPNRMLVSPIFFAVKNRSEIVMERLLRMKYRPDAYSLHEAVSQHVPFDLASRLIKECTDIDGAQCTGGAYHSIPIYTAARFGRLDLVKEMLNNGAELNAAPWRERNSEFAKSIQPGRSEIVDFLLRNGIDIKDIPRLRLYAVTALEVAASRGYLGIMRSILEYGANPDVARAVTRPSKR